MNKRLPEVPQSLDSIGQLTRYLRDLIRALETPEEINSKQYSLSSFTELTEIDPSTITTEELARVVATLLKDLKGNGIIDARDS